MMSMDPSTQGTPAGVPAGPPTTAPTPRDTPAEFTPYRWATPLAEIAPFARHPQSGKSMSELWRAHAQHDSPVDRVSLD